MLKSESIMLKPARAGPRAMYATRYTCIIRIFFHDKTVIPSDMMLRIDSIAIQTQRKRISDS